MTELTAIEEKMIKTNVFGDIHYTEKDIILFPEGIIGFEDKSQYIIYTKAGYEPFLWLICITDSSIFLPIIDPYLVMPDYEASSNNGELQSIGLDNVHSGKVFSIVTVGRDIHQVTTNLRGPIIINENRSLGKQIILSESEYSLKQPMLAGSQN
jgi:flagellar assembly factor FliW